MELKLALLGLKSVPLSTAAVRPIEEAAFVAKFGPVINDSTPPLSSVEDVLTLPRNSK